MVELAPPRPPCGPGRTAAGCADCLARPFSVCAAVPDADVAELEALADVRELAPDAVLFRQGDPADRVFNISSGSLRLYRLQPDGRRQILGFLFAGDFIGLTRDETWLCTAEAIESSRVCRFRRTEFDALVRSRRDLEASMLARARDDLAAAQSQVLRLGRRGALERVAGFLCELPQADPMRPGGQGEIRLPMTRGEIADYLGLTLESVSRSLSELKRRGVISQVSLTLLRVERADALQDLAGV